MTRTVLFGLSVLAVLMTGQPATAGEKGDHGEEHVDGPGGDHGGKHSSRLTDEAIPLQVEAVPKRPKPLLELGEPFLGTGTLKRGWELPTGAVWQPSLVVFGTLRAAAQSFDGPAGRTDELAARLDLFANLQLSGSERLVVGFRPLDRDGRFTRLVLDSDVPGVRDEFTDEVNGEITSLFFEGDFGEIFPNLSKDDSSATDIGFSVGRQPLFFQEGMIFNDTIDGVGLTRNTLQPRNTSNFRATLFWGWGEVGDESTVAGSPQVFALLTSADRRRSTIDVDVAFVSSDLDGDLLSAGWSTVQRIGKVNTAFRLLGSSRDAVGQEPSQDGFLAFSEVSWTPPYSHDLVYFNAFWAVDEFLSAARGPGTGGPLGRAGINFAAVGLGSYGAALSSRARDVAGGAVGYQQFFRGNRRQFLTELGFRIGTDAGVADAVALSGRYQAAIGRRFVVVLDAFAGTRESGSVGSGSQDLLGGRIELVTKF